MFCLIKKLSALEAVAAKEADTVNNACEDVTALLATDAVPNRLPVNDPVNEPDLKDPLRAA